MSKRSRTSLSSVKGDSRKDEIGRRGLNISNRDHHNQIAMICTIFKKAKLLDFD